MPDDAEVLKWVSAQVDLSQIEILRIATYAHNALIAERWQVGRVFVAGDAAHMMPPSAGQGLCSGIRDAINLAWKLDRVLSQRAQPALLDTYQRERQFHLREVVKGTLFIGSLLEAETSLQRWWRDRRLQAINSMPAVQSFFRQLSLRRPALQDGFLSSSLSLGGHHMPQTQVQAGNATTASMASTTSPQMLDDLLGYRFALIVKPGLVPPALADWARERDIGVWEIGRDFTDVDGRLLGWMQGKRIDFALVRPDHHLFGVGTANQIGNMQVEFDTGYWGVQ